MFCPYTFILCLAFCYVGYQPISDEEWQEMFQAFKAVGNHLSADEQSDWSDQITWDKLALLLVKQVGPKKAVSLLEEMDLPDGILSSDFHRACLLSGMVQKQQR